jgi:hypothetical protein
MLGGGLAGQSRLVDADEFAEAEPVILRYRLNAPLVLGSGLALGALGRSERRVRNLHSKVSWE